MFFQRQQHPIDTYWHRTLGPTLGAVAVFLLEVIQIIVLALAIIIPVRYFLIQPFYVQGASMEPNFYDREYLIIDEISYRFSDPARGDIVVFRYPRDPSQFFIKRVIGLPGEEVEIDDRLVRIYNEAYPDGIKLEEPYLDSAITNGNVRVRLGSDEYFLMGDNRDASMDSRSFGPVERSMIVGKAWLRGLPLNRVTLFETPIYDLP
ncbi:MAG: signal peptidase I [Patescibacteria group bacterium]